MQHPEGLFFIAFAAYGFHRAYLCAYDAEYRRLLLERSHKRWLTRMVWGTERLPWVAEHVWPKIGAAHAALIALFGVYALMYGVPG